MGPVINAVTNNVIKSNILGKTNSSALPDYCFLSISDRLPFNFIKYLSLVVNIGK